MYWLEGVGDQQVFWTDSEFSQHLSVDGGGAGSNDGVGGRILLNGLVDSLLLLCSLGHGLKHKGAALQGGGVVGDGQQPHSCFFALFCGKALINEVVPVLFNGFPAPFQSAFRVADDHAGQSVADYEGSLAGADGARAVYSDCFHISFLTSWPIHGSAAGTGR